MCTLHLVYLWFDIESNCVINDPMTMGHRWMDWEYIEDIEISIILCQISFTSITMYISRYHMILYHYVINAELAMVTLLFRIIVKLKYVYVSRLVKFTLGNNYDYSDCHWNNCDYTSTLIGPVLSSKCIFS